MTKFFKITAAVLVLTVVCAEAGFAGSEEDLEKIRASYLRGNYDEVIRLGSGIKPSKNEEKLRSLYYVGVSLLVKKRYDEARRKFEAVRKKGRKKIDYLDEVDIRIADTYYYAGSTRKAYELYQQVMFTYPKSEYMPAVLKRLADIAEKRGRFEQAESYLRKIKRNYPQSFEARGVKGIHQLEAGVYAVQVGSFIDVENAESLRTELSRKGYEPYIEKTKREGINFYRLRVGKYVSEAEAEALARELSRQGYSTTVVP